MKRSLKTCMSCYLVVLCLVTSIVSGVLLPYASAANVLPGDVNNDSSVNSTDYAILKRYLLEASTNIDLKAADLNNDNVVNSTDYAMLKRVLLGTIVIPPLSPEPSVTPTPTHTPVTTVSPTQQAIYIAYDELYSMNDSSINRATSEHFQIVWGNSGNITQEFVNGNLKNLEAIRECYIKELGIPDPGISIHKAYADTKRKTNLYIANTGLKNYNTGDWNAHMGSDAKGMGFMVICPEGMRVDPPSTVTAHEYGHVIHYHLKSWIDQTITGPWWESVANWFSERYMASDYYSYNGKNYSPQSEYFPGFYENLSNCHPNINDYYQYWPFLQYLEENPDNLPGLGKGFIVKMIQQANKNEYPFDNIARVANLPMKTILGNFAKRMATQDFLNPNNYPADKYNKLLNIYRTRFKSQISNAKTREKVLTTLNKSSDSGWWNVPDSHAPMQSGINIIPVTASLYSIDMTGTKTITADFQALSSQRTDGDFQLCLVAVDKAGKTAYSPLWSTGQGSITINQNTETLYLVVTAVPKTMIPTSAFDETSGSQVRFPYRVRFSSK